MKKTIKARRPSRASTPIATPTPTPALAPVLRPLCWLREALVRPAVLDAVEEDEVYVAVGLLMRYVLWPLEVETW